MPSRLPLLPPISDDARPAPSEPARTAGGDEGDLVAQISQRVARGVLVERAGERLRCTACAHRCSLEGGRAGACGVRFERDGQLMVPWGYIARRYVRPVETNTVYHVRPGAKALTFGMYGCDLRCPYCHNWRISQALREPTGEKGPVDMTARSLVDEAVEAGCEVVCAAYNEPMIAAEWVVEVLGEAKRRGLVTMVVSDGNTTAEALSFLRPVCDVFRVDLKGHSADQYRVLGGRPGPVLGSLALARELGFWVEAVTLVVPGFNDDEPGLRVIARAIAEVDPNIPWHLNAFHPRYKLRATPRMPAWPLVSAAGSAYAMGLRYVYVGNVDDQTRELSHTRCPRCHEVLIERADFAASRVSLEGGRCSCGEAIPGLFS